jgi:tripartite-type tricarboxylate transporter receptor subunit TctC
MQVSIRLSALILSAVLVSATDNGFAQTNFYEGKTIRMIVGFTAGGGYDAYTRTISRHMGKHIPIRHCWSKTCRAPAA